MGSEVHGPGAQATGPLQVTAPVARAWAVAAAHAAVRVPARCAEADAWTVRGWADVAVGCLALDGSEASASGASGPRPSLRPATQHPVTQHPVQHPATRGAEPSAAWMRSSAPRESSPAASMPPGSANCGGSPDRCRLWYPDARPVIGPVRRIRGIVWRAADLVSWFGELLLTTAATLPRDAPLPLISARQLAWGVRYRPSASHAHVTLRLPVHRRLGPAHLDVPARAPGAGHRDRRGTVHRDRAGAADLARHP